MIQILLLPTLDTGNPSVSSFSHGAVPAVFLDDGPSLTGKTCECLSQDWNEVSRDFEIRVHHVSWSRSQTDKAEGKEEIRRLCWSALSLISEHNSQCMALGRDIHDFSLNHPDNVSWI